MLVLHKDYQFTSKDVGKKALLANSHIVKIITVIREAGQLHSIYGVMPGYTDVIVWDAHGKSENESQNIVMIFNENEPTARK